MGRATRTPRPQGSCRHAGCMICSATTATRTVERYGTLVCIGVEARCIVRIDYDGFVVRAVCLERMRSWPESRLFVDGGGRLYRRRTRVRDVPGRGQPLTTSISPFMPYW